MKLLPEQIGAGVAVLLMAGGAFFNGGINTGEATQRAQLIRQTKAEQNEALDQLELSQKYAEQAAQIAIQRYDAGCVFVVGINQPENAVSVIEGQAVVDFYTLAPIPNGSIVCDFQGNTGVIADGVVSLPAFTGNRAVIEAAMLRAGFTPQGTTVQDNQFGG